MGKDKKKKKKKDDEDEDKKKQQVPRLYLSYGGKNEVKNIFCTSVLSIE